MSPDHPHTSPHPTQPSPITSQGPLKALNAAPPALSEHKLQLLSNNIALMKPQSQDSDSSQPGEAVGAAGPPPPSPVMEGTGDNESNAYL